MQISSVSQSVWVSHLEWESECGCVCVCVGVCFFADSFVLPQRPIVQLGFNHPLFNRAAWKRASLARCMLIELLLIQVKHRIKFIFVAQCYCILLCLLAVHSSPLCFRTFVSLPVGLRNGCPWLPPFFVHILCLHLHKMHHAKRIPNNLNTVILSSSFRTDTWPDQHISWTFC